jgi:hypothetical protein
MSFFKRFYLGVVQLLATLLLTSTNLVLRHLIVLKGKNPDFVAPPPAPPQVDVHISPRTSQITLPSTTQKCGWVNKPEDHPVLKSRKQFAAKKIEGLQGSKLNKVVPQPTAVIATETPAADAVAELATFTDNGTK